MFVLSYNLNPEQTFKTKVKRLIGKVRFGHGCQFGKQQYFKNSIKPILT